MEKTNKLQCPGCGANLALQARAAFSPEIMTVIYKLEPGSKMAVEDLCESLAALAKSLKAVSKELGYNVLVGIEDLSVSDSEIKASVFVAAC